MANNFDLNARLPSIYEEILKPSEVLVLMLPSNNAEVGVGPDMNVAMFRISRRNLLYAKIPIGNIVAGSGTGFNTLTVNGLAAAASGQAMFSLANTQQFNAYHAAFHVQSGDQTVRIGIQNPAGYVVTGFATPTPPSESPANNDVFGWYRNDLAQNNDVSTILTEQIYLYNLVPNFAVSVETSGTAITSGNILIHGAGYTMSQIIDEHIQDKILAGTYPEITKFKTYGAMLPFTVQMPPQWSNTRSLTSIEFDRLAELIASVK